MTATRWQYGPIQQLPWAHIVQPASGKPVRPTVFSLVLRLRGIPQLFGTRHIHHMLTGRDLQPRSHMTSSLSHGWACHHCAHRLSFPDSDAFGHSQILSALARCHQHLPPP